MIINNANNSQVRISSNKLTVKTTLERAVGAGMIEHMYYMQCTEQSYKVA